MTLVATLEEVTDPLAGGCVPVPLSSAGFCEMCHRPCGDWSRCWSCNETTSYLTRPCDLVVPIAFMSKDSQLYATLRQYKWEPGPAQRQAAARTVGMVGRFLRDHAGCIEDAAGMEWDVITHVQSGSGRHPEPHPMAQCFTLYPPLKKVHETLLTRGAGVIARNVGDDEAYVALPSAKDQRVLLVDDTWTTGAHAQSAASALSLTGARRRHRARGRLIDPDRDSEWWETQRRQPFDFDACCLG